MLLAVKERYPFKDDLMPEKKKWADIEKGVRYLREYAVVEMLHSPDFIPDEPDQEHDPERVRCTPNVVYIHKDCTRKVCQYICSNVWQRRKKTPYK